MGNLILKAAGKQTSAGMFWRLLLGTIVMLACGYAGETKLVPAGPGFVGGMAGWFFILNEIFNGEAGGTAAECSEAVASSFKTMRLIVTVGWSSTLLATCSATCSETWIRPRSIRLQRCGLS